MRINVGCGTSPIVGWVNFDNSYSVRFFEYPFIARLLHKFRLINSKQMHFIETGQSMRIRWADAKRLPVNDSSADIIYSSHMLEHLDRVDAVIFLAEAKRVLKTGGIIRLCLPDLKILVETYLVSQDADSFVDSTLMTIPRARTLKEKFLAIVVGPRHHQWMYDGKSMAKLLERNGFVEIKILPPGVSDTSKTAGVDLFQHSDHSFYVEAKKP